MPRPANSGTRSKIDLRNYARGKQCQIRLPGCSHDPGETRLAHLRQAGITGGAQKAPDILGAWACHHCSLITENGYAPSEGVVIAFYEGMARTQYELIKAGVVRW